MQFLYKIPSCFSKFKLINSQGLFYCNTSKLKNSFVFTFFSLSKMFNRLSLNEYTTFYPFVKFGLLSHLRKTKLVFDYCK